MVNIVKFTINTSFDGTATYELYEGATCDIGGILITSGTTEVINGISEVYLNNISLSDNMSIKVIDSKLCETCQSFNVTFADCTPFSGTAEYIEVFQPTEVDVFYQYNSNEFGYGQLKFSYINISNQNSILPIDHLDQVNPESTSSNFFVKSNTFIEVDLRNDSNIITETSMVISINGVVVYNSGVTTNIALKQIFEVNEGDIIAVNAITNGDNPLAP